MTRLTLRLVELATPPTGLLTLAGTLFVLTPNLGCSDEPPPVTSSTIQGSEGGEEPVLGTGGQPMMLSTTGGGPNEPVATEGTVLCNNGCPSGAGCILAYVSRSDDDSAQPWVVVPAEADGIGTLRFSIEGTEEDREWFVERVNLRSVGSYYQIPMCVAPITGTLRVYLDDNLNADGETLGSSEYVDSCPAVPATAVTIVAGNTLEIPVILNNSCN